MNKLSNLVLAFLLSTTAQAGEPDDYIFVRIGAGAQGKWATTNNGTDWEGSDELAAVFHTGYKYPINQDWWLDVTFTHNSQWFRGKPFNSKGEDELDSLSLGIEYRWY